MTNSAVAGESIWLMESAARSELDRDERDSGGEAMSDSLLELSGGDIVS